jgi:hypothetical protein
MPDWKIRLARPSDLPDVLAADVFDNPAVTQGRTHGCSTTWVLTEDDNHAARATYATTGGAATTGVVMYEWDETPSESTEHS